MSISSAQASQDRPNVLDFKPMLDAVDAVLGDAARPVELHEPRFGARERELVLDCIDTNWVSSAGKYVTRFEEMVAAATGSRHAVAIVNGTAALHAALVLEGVEQNDEVLLPSITFVATANAVRYCGARPVFADVVSLNDWNVDAKTIERALTPATKAVPAAIAGRFDPSPEPPPRKFPSTSGAKPRISGLRTTM